MIKKYMYIGMVLLLLGCKPSNTTTEISENVKKMTCPEKGMCSVELIKNKTLSVKKDGTGKFYPVLEESNNAVILFNYLEEGPEGTADGDYSETIHFEIPYTTSKLNIENEALTEVKLLFGKHCFCKGDAGYYKVSKGFLKLEKKKGFIAFELTFKIDETSHKVSTIKETLKL